MRFINSGDNVVWSVAVILTSFRSVRLIAATVLMVATVIVMAVTMASFIGALVTTGSLAVSARILVEANFGLFSAGVLIGGHDHLTDPLSQLTIEFGAEVVVMESSDECGDDFCFRDVRNRIPHLGKSSDFTTEELERFSDKCDSDHAWCPADYT